MSESGVDLFHIWMCKMGILSQSLLQVQLMELLFV